MVPIRALEVFSLGCACRGEGFEGRLWRLDVSRVLL